ncbi:hypothetical protein [Halalkalirubrum salinum]|uniref:hypothetical protein n=1 Tax=Halalkalirubrum salinum TaxID=2563889 RepID=UPI0010FB122C|nr:hypothetical protein [Halalkalirubrum salinum]
MSGELSRRRLLRTIGTAVGASIAGCLFDDGPEPIDAEARDLREIAAMDVPARAEPFPIEVDAAYVEREVDRVESLLEEIPSALETEIPNEAVRQYIDNEREDTRQKLNRADDEETNIGRLGPLRGARSDSEEANGAYRAARGELTRAEITPGLTELRERAAGRAESLTVEGRDPHEAIPIYDRIERRLAAAIRALDRPEPPSTVSTVEAVGELSGRTGFVRAATNDAMHLLERHRESVHDPEPFGEAIEQAIDAMDEEITTRVETIPDDPNRHTLFDAETDSTPRAPAGEQVLRLVQSSVDRYRDNDPESAQGFTTALDALCDLQMVDRLRTVVEEGGLGRPEDETAVEDAKISAVESIEDARATADTGSQYLLEPQLSAAISSIHRGDDTIERHADRSVERAALWSIAEYAIADARATVTNDAVAQAIDALE